MANPNGNPRAVSNAGNYPKSAAHRHQLFVLAYLATYNATAAAIKAGYSEHSAGVQGSHLLKNPKIIAAIEAKNAQIAARYGVTAERVIQELAKIAFANIEDYTRLTPDGERYIDLSDATREELAALGEITIEDYVDGRGDNARSIRRTKIKLHDKRAALETLAKHLGLFDGHEAPNVTNIQQNLIVANTAPEDLPKLYMKLVEGSE